ncbi:adenylosuccinate lyase [Campylobacter sputorum subsp. bubulus]|uniref:Adenylosuccinate lyase n=1 Tax=Campylobacter sputorum subsp. sputorum TaxID=32024 RepID=A0A381DJG3_9BACT|nr:adenylosuccinate lyase [Campylobacter sputorum]ASM35796.1 adenylosuccinate lyase [Campylobacter sputorum aubsp. sputorum RM3237]KAB0581500.1 adenylosuccinate lyase [Campylobacter sputorum subsp. sputorum]QEL05986.1 adenylosuccinate lyase [Campylobacter sputorum subsp. sputorum]SUX09084.1 adenylosuccinate lyase [Campylobacter sputorum subsp. bubulus]SUX10775.1 adenylosuccinate lyase [Campylobacter sputorum subsp. sputorum]
MVERYARKEMKEKWSIQAKYDAWLEVEKAAIKAWNKLGLINDSDCEKIIKNAKFNVDRIDEIEKTTKHDVIAFLTSVSESLGDESRFVHFAMTSSDTIDTAVALQIRDSLNLIISDVKNLMNAIKKRAFEHKNTLMVGRSHGIHGEPITFGLVLAIWYDEISRSLELLEHAKKIISVGKISGAMGNFAHAPLDLEELVCEFLELKPAPASNQVIQRDRYAQVMSALAILASSCEKIAVTIRHYQRTEVYEAEEYFSPGQKGSSAMPHKRNPVLSENVTGLCRMIRSYVMPAMENVALWHERDISHSSVERFILPDGFITADFMLNRLTNLIDKLVVYPENMLRNLNLTGGLVFSQRVLLELPKKGVSREDAYKIVQRNAMKVWGDLQEGKKAIDENGHSLFLQNLLNDEDLNKALSKDEIKECFDYAYYTKNVDKIFTRVFK